MDGNVLKRSEVAAALRNTQKHSQSEIVAPQKTFDERKVDPTSASFAPISSTKAAPERPFGAGPARCRQAQGGRLDELKATVSGIQVPVRGATQRWLSVCWRQAVGKSDDWYLNDFDLGDELLEAKENLIDPIQSFLNGAQRSIYDDAVELLAGNANNLAYLPGASDAEVRALLEDRNAFRGNRMAQLKEASTKFRAAIDAVIVANRADAANAIESRKRELVASAYYAAATGDVQEQVSREMDQIIDRIAGQHQVALIREICSSFEVTLYPELLDRLAASAREFSRRRPA